MIFKLRHILGLVLKKKIKILRIKKVDTISFFFSLPLTNKRKLSAAKGWPERAARGVGKINRRVRGIGRDTIHSIIFVPKRQLGIWIMEKNKF